MKTLAPLAVVASLLLPIGALCAENPVIVHEWGTFTSLQDDNGKAIGGINVDDEPVPDFVYGFGGVRALNHTTYGPGFGLPPYFDGKGWMPGDQEVTMRLETPVLYFYPPKGATPVPSLDVHVEFHGGILSQYYPYAILSGLPGNPPGAQTHLIPQDMHIGDVTSQLEWKGVQLGSAAKPVTSDDKVWTTPREVGASLVETKKPVRYGDNGEVVQTKSETEHFLFYRGVGHLDSPVFLNSHGMRISVAMHDVSESVTSGWLVQIRPDGMCASRFIQNEAFGVPTTAMASTGGMLLWNNDSPRSFADSDFAADSLSKLKDSMQAALIKAGLYPDEASAMLRTWELSYFKSPGLRFFYIVPRGWVDTTLPLTITGAPVQVTRVMVGRIELISDEQKGALARLASEPYIDLNALKKDAAQILDTSPAFTRQEKADFQSGARPLTDLGITLSPSVRDYLSLGRFRDALMMHEEQEHPSENFARFIKENGLAAQ